MISFFKILTTINTFRMKKFYGVRFTNNEVAIVPASWIHKQKKSVKSSWPDAGEPIELAKQEADPLKSWSLFACSIITSSSNIDDKHFFNLCPHTKDYTQFLNIYLSDRYIWRMWHKDKEWSRAKRRYRWWESDICYYVSITWIHWYGIISNVGNLHYLWLAFRKYTSMWTISYVLIGSGSPVWNSTWTWYNFLGDSRTSNHMSFL